MIHLYLHIQLQFTILLCIHLLVLVCQGIFKVNLLYERLALGAELLLERTVPSPYEED